MLKPEQLEFGKGWKMPESQPSRFVRRDRRTLIRSVRNSGMLPAKNAGNATGRGDLSFHNDFQSNGFCQDELQNRLYIRSWICRFLIQALGFSIVCCFCLILLNGFRLWGFQMDGSLLRWLCGATIAQIAVLLGVFVRAVWQKSER